MNEAQRYTRDWLQRHAQILVERMAEAGVNNIRVFGSFATGTATGSSDLDLLVDIPATATPRRWSVEVDLEIELTERLGRKVEVVRSDQIFHLLRPRILQEARPLAVLVGDRPDWAPVLPKDPRHHLWLLAYWLEQLAGYASKTETETDTASDAAWLVKRGIWRCRERLSARLEKLSPAERAQFPGLPWDELANLVEPFRFPEETSVCPADDTETGLEHTLRQAENLANAIRAILPDDETLAREIAGEGG